LQSWRRYPHRSHWRKTSKPLTVNNTRNASVIHVEPDGITIKFSGGISKIPCEEITKADQQRFNCCDPQKAVAYAAEQAAAIQRTNQEIQESNKRAEVEKQKVEAEKRKASEVSRPAQSAEGVSRQNTANGPRIVGVGGVNGLEVEVDDKRLQLEAEARAEAMTPREKQNQYARDMKKYEGAKQVAARRGLNANLIVPPQYGQVHYDPFAKVAR
jgi:hypothetical protein